MAENEGTFILRFSALTADSPQPNSPPPAPFVRTRVTSGSGAPAPDVPLAIGIFFGFYPANRAAPAEPD